MDNLTFSAFGKTDKGQVRLNNEDAFLSKPESGLFAVADGLGGLAGGEVASESAINALSEFPQNGTINFSKIFKAATKAVNKLGKDIDTDIGIATTLTILKISDNKGLIGHVGDSGVLIFSGDSISKPTTDHTMANDMEKGNKTGAEMNIPEYFKHMLTRCIGKASNSYPDEHEFQINSGDRILLYTDGVSKVFSFEELKGWIFNWDNPREFVENLVEECNKRGGPDNITAIAVFVD